MEIEDNGKERRNSLLVSSAVAAAALLHLKVPSFISEFVKLDIPRNGLSNAWWIAAVLIFYAGARYHFSNGRKEASKASNAEFAQAVMNVKFIGDVASEARLTAINDLSDQLRRRRIHNEDGEYIRVGVDDLYPASCSIWASRDGGMGQPDEKINANWRLKGDFVSLHQTRLGTFRPVVTTSNTLTGSSAWRLGVKKAMHRLLWSTAVWEVNTVYVTAAIAISLCVARADAAKQATTWALSCAI